VFRRDILSWWLRPSFLRPSGRRSDTLFAGPWVGEFGWELMNWQAFVRKLSRGYKHTIVCCPAGREALYADFATTIIPHRLRGIAECNVMHNVENPDELARVMALVPQGADHLKPLGYQPFSRQEFIRLGSAKPDLRVDVLFHPRGRTFGTDRNWSLARWSTLLTTLRARGLTLGCIGVSGATLDLTSLRDLQGAFADWRDRPLSETLDVIASAGVVVGPSSGPMHLASLCGTPHVVWTDRQRYARGRTNRDKYEGWWNPLGTPVTVLDEEAFDPQPLIVADAITALLARGGRG
jgi:ADP-heptose:LPS heptosyltransferase